MSELQERYQALCLSWSDVQAHLPLLYEEARGTVLELGTRGGTSTTALLAGVEAHGGELWSVDRDDCSGLFVHPLWRFVQADSCDVAALVDAGLAARLNVLFIDTAHTYEQTYKELLVWRLWLAPQATILLHDAYDGSTFPGVVQAVGQFCMECGLGFSVYPDSYGLAVIHWEERQ